VRIFLAMVVAVAASEATAVPAFVFGGWVAWGLSLPLCGAYGLVAMRWALKT
jgi:hypothetical protein